MKLLSKKPLQSVILVVLSSPYLIAGGDIPLPEPDNPDNSILKIHTPLNYSDEWKFQLAPMFLWGMSMKGESQIGPVTAPLDLDFTDDILENLAAVFTVHFEAHKGDWGLFTEYQYVKLEPSTTINEIPPITADTEFTNEMFEIGATYTFMRTSNTKWEALGGLRYTRQKNNTKILYKSLVDVSEDWTDGFVGLRNTFKVSDNWLLLSRADIGGGDSDFVWNVAVMADYRFNDWGSAFIGYRWMDYDYDNGKIAAGTYTYNATQQGPLLGLNIHW